MHHVLCELGLEELLNVVRSNEVESISVLKILLQQQILHFCLCLYPLHVNPRDCHDFFAKGLAPDIKLAELVTDIVEALNQKA